MQLNAKRYTKFITFQVEIKLNENIGPFNPVPDHLKCNFSASSIVQLFSRVRLTAYVCDALSLTFRDAILGEVLNFISM